MQPLVQVAGGLMSTARFPYRFWRKQGVTVLRQKLRNWQHQCFMAFWRIVEPQSVYLNIWSSEAVNLQSCWLMKTAACLQIGRRLAQRRKDKSGNTENLFGIEFGGETNMIVKQCVSHTIETSYFLRKQWMFFKKISFFGCKPSQPSPFWRFVRGDAYSNDMELATMLSNLRVPAPKQLPRDDLVKDPTDHGTQWRVICSLVGSYISLILWRILIILGVLPYFLSY